MNQIVAGGTSFDFSKADQVASFEVVLPVLELPQRMLWATIVEHIAHCQYNQLLRRPKEPFGLPAINLPLWNPYMLSCRTKEEMLVCLKYCLKIGR